MDDQLAGIGHNNPPREYNEADIKACRIHKSLMDRAVTMDDLLMLIELTVSYKTRMQIGSYSRGFIERQAMEKAKTEPDPNTKKRIWWAIDRYRQKRRKLKLVANGS